MSFGEIFYKRLPEIYKKEDRNALNPYQLKKYLRILGEGFDDIEKSVDSLKFNFDMDLATTETITPSAKLLGFNFPYNMTENEKRNLVKILPLLYRNKGNAKVFEYLANVIFGQYSNPVTIDLEKSTMLVGSNPNAHCITIGVSYLDELPNLLDRLRNYIMFVEEFRPVNLFLKYVFKPFTEEVGLLKIVDTILDLPIVYTNEYVLYDIDEFYFDTSLLVSTDNYSIVSVYIDEPLGFNIPRARLNETFILSSWQNPFCDYVKNKYYDTLYYHEIITDEESENTVREACNRDYYLYRTDTFLTTNSNFKLNSTLKTFGGLPDQSFDTITYV